MQKTEKEIIEEVVRIEFQVRKILAGLSLGIKTSTFKGHGMTFSDIRSYEPGDDIRNFAWQVMAKTGEPYVKQFEEERDLEVHVALDLGTSMKFGGLKKSKALIQAYVLAFMGLSTAKSKDKFGGLLFSNKQVKRLPALRGEDHVRRFLFSYLEEFNRAVATQTLSDGNIALDYFSKLRSKNTLCVLVSDFAKPLNRKLLARVKSRHQVKIIFVQDPYEKNFPGAGGLWALGTKGSRKPFWFKPTKRSNQFFEEYQVRKEAELTRLSRGFGMDCILQSTHDEDLSAIVKSLKLRSVYG